MPQITVVYKDFEEMKAVAREILKTEPDAGQSKDVPVMPTIPETPPVPAKPEAPVTTEAPLPDTASGPMPTAAPTYTRDELSRAAMVLMDKGMQVQLQQLIQSYGVNSLVELPQEQYGNFATALRGMGAQI